ncbi:hypothetical protein COU60_03285 [Candidatus Pacearchaeota archaeon CG10_big_fil_rev_8_21_14_0_10_34_76]|nr:MAG: hypothetical protein COU60_03285 [Candidatus Pacearchaeota archaeon CG10_big_fil_rev_8_21_14_0_10_34_76]
MIYNPSDDSYLLQEQVRKKSKDKKVLDMGSGSGIQALTAKESGAKSVIASDIDEESINFLKKKGLNTIKSDLFSNISEKFDLIVFNPPYLPRDPREDNESSLATTGGEKGDEIYLKFFQQVPNYLNKNGSIIILISSLTPRKRIASLLNKLNLRKNALSKKKLFMELLEVWEIN